MRNLDVEDIEILQIMKHEYWAILPEKCNKGHWIIFEFCTPKHVLKLTFISFGTKNQFLFFSEDVTFENYLGRLWYLNTFFSRKRSWNEAS